MNYSQTLELELFILGKIVTKAGRIFSRGKGAETGSIIKAQLDKILFILFFF